jgi:hypothetical protein
VIGAVFAGASADCAKTGGAIAQAQAASRVVVNFADIVPLATGNR